MIVKLLEKVKESYPDNYSEVEQIIKSNNYHRLLSVDLKNDIKIKILRTIFSKNYVNIFKTRKARELQIQLINKIKNYITTDYAKELLLTFFPTTDVEEIKRRQLFVESSKHIFESISGSIDMVKTFIKLISEISYESNKRHNGVVVAFADESLYVEMKHILSKKFYVTLIESENDLMSIDHYEQIRFIPGSVDSFTRVVEQLPQATVFLGNPSLDEIAPEFITDLVDKNAEAIEALYSLNAFVPLKNLPSKPSSSTSRRVVFAEIELSLSSLAKDLGLVIQEQISKANFPGDTLMTIISKKKSLIDLLDKDSQAIISQKKQQVMSSASNILGLSTSALFDIDYVGSVSIDESQLSVVKQQFLTFQEQNITKQKQTIALSAKKLIEALPSLVEEVYNVDLSLAIGNFVSFYSLEKPILVDKGISFVYGRNMNISNAVPVEYYIGTSENISVLTGANSGGKTTLLELLAQIQLLTQMGLFVPAREVNVGIVEEFYYFSKNKGSLNAGAFETLLKQFADINGSNSSRLVLADEIESVTEPSVAAKIIEGIIAHLSRQNKTLLVLVTHMGNELSSKSIPCRFDGIEAKGLDDELNLVVDRNPVIGRLARSTPQLIVERLAKLDNNVFYSDLHKSLISN